MLKKILSLFSANEKKKIYYFNNSNLDNGYYRHARNSIYISFYDSAIKSPIG